MRSIWQPQQLRETRQGVACRNQYLERPLKALHQWLIKMDNKPEQNDRL
jgi:hypothetical protein